MEPTTAADPERLGAYRVVGRVGVGGMGAVYAGLAPDGGCAAVKVIHPQFAADSEFRARFAREVGMVSRVRATCTAGFLGADTSGHTPWMATEYVPGRTLRQFVRENGPLSGGVLTALAVGLAEALVAIHEADVVHRDLKPGNVILSPTGPKVLDFGIARAVEGTALTRTGGLMGTPGWTSPEQYRGEAATERSDMFAWAGLVAFAATGRNPFGTGAADVLSHRTREEEPDLDGVPDELSDLVRRAFAKDPGQRPTAERALAELTEAWNTTRIRPVEGSPPTEVVPALLATEWRGVGAPAPRRVRRGRRTPLLAVSAAALVLVVLGGWFAVRQWSGPAENGAQEEAAGQEGDVGGSGSGTGGGAPAVETDPEGVGAVVAEAVDLALDASSFVGYQEWREAEMGEGATFEYSYTEDPRPLYLQTDHAGPAVFTALEIGEGPDDHLWRSDAYIGAGLVEGDFYRLPEGETEDSTGEAWEDAVRRLEQVLAPDSEVAYEGVRAVPTEDYRESVVGDRDLTGRAGHHYTGDFVTQVSVGRGEGAWIDAEAAFDMWIGEDGYPLHLQVYESWEEEGTSGTFIGGYSRTTVFVEFGGPVEIEVPDESEIADSKEEARPR